MQNEERKFVLKILAVRQKAKMALNLKEERSSLKEVLKLDEQHALQQHQKMVQQAKEMYETRQNRRLELAFD